VKSTSVDGRATKLLERGYERQIPAISQLITALESSSDMAPYLRSELHARGGSSHVVGITGAPGSGKSTLVNSLAKEFRARDKTVGIIAVDPSSSLSGGAILGDRIRMQEHTLDAGIFVRSMASRGTLGGVSKATVDSVSVLNATGWDIIIVETVGVGQADVEIMRIAHTTVVVSVPGLGDDIQAIKAGLMEIADLHVVNKADRPESDKAVADLKNMLMLGGMPPPDGWVIPVLSTVGLTGKGIAELTDSLEEHMNWLISSGELVRRERTATEARIRVIAKDLLMESIHAPGNDQNFQSIVGRVLARELDPHTAAAGLIGRIAVAS
jgi:LAO/AO transport system kinase